MKTKSVVFPFFSIEFQNFCFATGSDIGARWTLAVKQGHRQHKSRGLDPRRESAVKLKWIILIVSFNEDVRSVQLRLAAFRCVKFCDRSHPENGVMFCYIPSPMLDAE